MFGKFLDKDNKLAEQIIQKMLKVRARIEKRELAKAFVLWREYHERKVNLEVFDRLYSVTD